MKRLLLVAVSAAMLTVAFAAPVLAKPIGPNPFPAVSQSVCVNTYGGVFSGGGNNKTCVVTTTTSGMYYHAQAQIGHGGWFISTTSAITYTIVNGTRDAVGSTSTTCRNPAGKLMTNTSIRPCQPSSYPIGPI